MTRTAWQNAWQKVDLAGKPVAFVAFMTRGISPEVAPW